MNWEVKGDRKNRKYKNRRIVLDGVEFDSEREANRYISLRALEKCDKITNLEMQKSFKLVDTIATTSGKLKQSNYVCDFYYFDIGRQEWIVEDVKGCITDLYSLKKKLFILNYDITFFENGAKKKYYKKTS